MEYIPIRISDLLRQLNRDVYLPAIQREFVWDMQRIERLFDSIMCQFPVGSFLFWRLDQAHRDDWPVYKFVSDFDAEAPHNEVANMSGITRDVTLVLDGQQRITSLFIGLRGSFSYFYYRRRKAALYLNLLKVPQSDADEPEELTHEFKFRESAEPDPGKQQLWYRVGRILDTPADAEDAKSAIEKDLVGLTPAQQENAKKLIGRLHNRIFTTTVGNYYEEQSQDYDKVLQVFVRANAGGKPLEYSDLLLATATARWETYDARREVHEFTDALNTIGPGYDFGKDFVLKASLYLCEDLPIQYRLKNFTRTNLSTIEANWESIKEALGTTVRLMARFGFTNKNIVAPLALLPIALFVKRHEGAAFDTSSKLEDAVAQVAIRRWFIFVTLKNAFGSSSDTVLTRLRELLVSSDPRVFPSDALYTSLAIEPRLSDAEIARALAFSYQGRYTNLVLSLLYPDQSWKEATFHEDHIYPQSEFQTRALRARGYDDERIARYQSKSNLLPNLELLTATENVSKNATDFSLWITTRDATFKDRHRIPALEDYGFDHFEEFFEARTVEIRKVLAAL